MDTRKVQQLGPSTLAMTLPAEWASEFEVEKGDEVTLRRGGKGTLTVMAEAATGEGSEATIHADGLDAEGLERAILAQYVLGRRVIHVTSEEGVLPSEHINAVYSAESQLMGLGVVEETPENISIRCSVDPADFDLDNLLERLENTGSTMRGEAIKAISRDNPDLAQRALNRERQANKIFVLLLRLIFTAYQNPNLARAVGLDDGFPLIGYRSVAKNLELTADNAEDVADIALDTEGESLDLEASTVRQLRELNEQVDELTTLAVRSAVERDYDATMAARAMHRQVRADEQALLAELPEMRNEQVLAVREVLVNLRQTAEYAVRNAEIAANLALSDSNEHVTIE